MFYKINVKIEFTHVRVIVKHGITEYTQDTNWLINDTRKMKDPHNIRKSSNNYPFY